MTPVSSPQPISPLRVRMIEDMTVHGFKDDTQRDYVRQVRAFAAFIEKRMAIARTATRHDYRN